MQERWLPVPGYESLYEVSDEGNVRSLDGEVRGDQWNGGYQRTGRVLATRPGNKYGHLKVTLSKNGVVRSYWVHRLVALVWCVRSEGQDYVLHGREGEKVNAARNLRWGTPLENMADMREFGKLHVHVPQKQCSRGHDLTDDNVYVPPKRPNERRCRKCQRRRERKSRVGITDDYSC